LSELSFVDLDVELINRELERNRQHRRSGPMAENLLRDVGSR
jgi:pyruvate ferredoxin oxidoreductase alpha subunit